MEVEGWKWEVYRYREDREGSSVPRSTNERLRGMKAKCIIDGRNQWMEMKIREKFDQSEAKDILKMPLGKDDSKDEIIWKPDKRGLFTVKSAYHMAPWT